MINCSVNLLLDDFIYEKLVSHKEFEDSLNGSSGSIESAILYYLILGIRYDEILNDDF